MRKKDQYIYSSLTDILREQILSGFIKKDEFLMSENELSKYYELSRSSVRKSLDLLLKEGLVVKKAGLGTFVSPNVTVQKSKRKVLRILTITPSYFVDHCLPFICQTFEQQHPDVDIKLLSFPIAQFWESLNRCIEMGIQPDICIITDGIFQELKSMDDFVSLDRIMEPELTSVYPNLLNGFRKDGNVKAIPVTFSSICLAYNPRMFDKYNVAPPGPGWNKEAFIQTAGQLTFDTNEDGIIDNYGFSLPSTLNRWNVIAMQNGVDYNKPNKQALLDTLTFMHDMIYRKRSALLSHLQLHRVAFQSEQVAMMLTTTIELAGFGEKLPFEPKFAPMAFGDTPKTLLIANALMVHAASTERELAIQFLQTACHPDVQDKIGKSRFLSVLHPINERHWDRQDLESLHISDGQLREAYYQHETITNNQRMLEVNNELMLYWEGMESAEQCAQRLYKLLSPRKKNAVR
ncbi:extracellular solute-binding protein [Paenibacillus qinlingensis]|uniref:Multiple sugar transport system substrate-binding protein n=1 Tax=Paenibacillus qinlingensis TaxID=1837343 RepID=A0ABU1NRA8_9BACL|nr:extracellular solute-binding protein [Paenibacillus qinlingensis]MDR6549980.1 multiple sugar transport system substrate-binding protein [Paenibacillus qinlingensis]